MLDQPPGNASDRQKMASVHVVIVNWNSGTQLKECLQSFAAVAADDVTLARVSVVDNASTDGSCDGLPASAALPLVLLRNADNRGFGAACNQGAAGSDADYILFLNPDTRLTPGGLELPARYLGSQHHAAVGIVGIQLADQAGAVARNTARAPTALSMIGHSLGLDRLGLVPRHFNSEWPHDETRTVDQVMGAFFFVRREVFEALGGFDERFFVYFEDMDFAQRARQHGWSSVFLASARAFHRGHGTTHRATERRTFYFLRSKLHYAFKFFGPLGATAVMTVTLLLEPAARIVAAPRETAATLRVFARLWKELPAILRGK
jgi:N-acetylglucosaminyl-diphospho-decaprenol L-rhamnosyltransferase